MNLGKGEPAKRERTLFDSRTFPFPFTLFPHLLFLVFRLLRADRPLLLYHHRFRASGPVGLPPLSLLTDRASAASLSCRLPSCPRSVFAASQTPRQCLHRTVS